MSDWSVAIVGIAAALGLAAAIAWFGSDQGATVGGVALFVMCGAFAYLVQWVAFVHAWVTRSEAYFDITGSMTYVGVTVVALVLAQATDLRSLVIAGSIVVWALRLGSFLFRRVKRAGEDRRFRTIRNSFPTFLMTWTLQGTWVFITASCAWAAITSSASAAPDATLWVGLGLWVAGFTVEVIADRQKTAFRDDPSNTNRFITTGLWGWSRHPNYFGEIVLWVGIAVMAYPALRGLQVVTFASPLFVVLLLTAISGVRMLEARANRQWGADADYQAYQRSTPVLMLWPPRRR